jgi:cytochrome c-type biogenesis protein CcmE|tara:strand:- start:793 stop:1239 length:447 start_codon:yes stop_codon:yes gene_type:complete
MNPKRKNRLFMASFLLIGVAGSIFALFVALEQNLNMFYPPSEVVSGVAPIETNIRAGGMVEEDSLIRASNSLKVSFVLSDRAGSEFTVYYTGILPDLFREGQGILVEGELQQDGSFEATEVLAKHDENYMPPELMSLAEDKQNNTTEG